jgi:hypothetical protein
MCLVSLRLSDSNAINQVGKLVIAAPIKLHVTKLLSNPPNSLGCGLHIFDEHGTLAAKGCRSRWVGVRAMISWLLSGQGP